MSSSPVSDARHTAAAQPAAVRTPPTSQRVLIVDDDPLILKSLQDVLTAGGHTVVSASGGQAGIETVRAAADEGRNFDMVITDLGMPYVDGRHVAGVVKHASPGTAVILLTGSGQRLVAEGDVPPEVDCVLSKPPKGAGTAPGNPLLRGGPAGVRRRR
jgi:CheY-like chemotaxis protein